MQCDDADIGRIRRRNDSADELGCNCPGDVIGRTGSIRSLDVGPARHVTHPPNYFNENTEELSSKYGRTSGRWRKIDWPERWQFHDQSIRRAETESGFFRPIRRGSGNAIRALRGCWMFVCPIRFGLCFRFRWRDPP